MKSIGCLGIIKIVLMSLFSWNAEFGIIFRMKNCAFASSMIIIKIQFTFLFYMKGKLQISIGWKTKLQKNHRYVHCNVSQWHDFCRYSCVPNNSHVWLFSTFAWLKFPILLRSTALVLLSSNFDCIPFSQFQTKLNR